MVETFEVRCFACIGQACFDKASNVWIMLIEHDLDFISPQRDGCNVLKEYGGHGCYVFYRNKEAMEVT